MRRPPRLLAVLALVAALLAPAPAAIASARFPTVAEYRDRVVAASAEIASARGGAWRDASASEQVAARVDALLPGTERVLVGGQPVDVDNGIMRSLLARVSSSTSASDRRQALDDAAAHIRSLLLALDEGVAPMPGDRALLARLLARPDLSSRPTLADAAAKLVEDLTRWLAAWFGRVVRRRGVATASDFALGAVFVALGMLLVAAIVQVVRGLSASLARHDERVLAESAADAAVVAAAQGLPPDALAYAETLAGEARFREAVRALFGGAARSLVDLGLVRSTRTRTNRELLDDLAPAASPVLPPLTELSDAFEKAWYGHADPGEAGYAHARERYRVSIDAAERVREQGEHAEEPS
jgi:hypothetical protein